MIYIGALLKSLAGVMNRSVSTKNSGPTEASAQLLGWSDWAQGSHSGVYYMCSQPSSSPARREGGAVLNDQKRRRHGSQQFRAADSQRFIKQKRMGLLCLLCEWCNAHSSLLTAQQRRVRFFFCFFINHKKNLFFSFFFSLGKQFFEFCFVHCSSFNSKDLTKMTHLRNHNF